MKAHLEYDGFLSLVSQTPAVGSIEIKFHTQFYSETVTYTISQVNWAETTKIHS